MLSKNTLRPKTRWRERRETQVKQEREAREKRRRATEEAAKAAAKAAARAKAAAKEAKKGRKESSSYGGGGGSRGGSMANGHAYRGSDKSNRGTGRGRDRESAPTWRNQPEGLEEEDDMPATLERLGVPQQQQQHQHHRQLNGTGVRDPRDNGIGSHPQYNNSRGSRGGSEMEHGVSKRKGAGITGGEGGWIIEEAYHSAPYPQRMDSGGLPIESSRGMVKPPPLSVGACTTPAEAFLDRDRDRGDDSWGDFGDESWGAGNGDPRVMRVGLLEEPEEEEVRRVDMGLGVSLLVQCFLFLACLEWGRGRLDLSRDCFVWDLVYGTNRSVPFFAEESSFWDEKRFIS